MKSVLVIQTAYPGDVILATSLIETIHFQFPGAAIDLLLRKGNESLFDNHPFIREVIVRDKSQGNVREICMLLLRIRRSKYDAVVCLQRFAFAGFITAFSGARIRTGFSQTPFSFRFTRKVRHVIDGSGSPHEIQRNYSLVKDWVNSPALAMKLYPAEDEIRFPGEPYITISPASVWFSKQWPEEKWVEFIRSVPIAIPIKLLGGKADRDLCERISRKSGHKNTENLAGTTSFLQSAAWIGKAAMNYSNDSAALHIASAMNAPVTAVFCSTVPAFGFGPTSDNGVTIETENQLNCRPCGIHGRKSCPEKHFGCAEIPTGKLLARLPVETGYF